jgi:hypothetical protein
VLLAAARIVPGIPPTPGFFHNKSRYEAAADRAARRMGTSLAFTPRGTDPARARRPGITLKAIN